MDFRQKIDRILSIKQIRLYKLAEISKMGNTLEKAYQDNREMTETSTEKFLRNMGVNSEWWKRQKGPEFLIQKEENITPVENEPAIIENNPDPGEIYRKIVEGGTEYLLIPKTALEGKYRLVAIEHISQQEKELERRDNELIRKDHQIMGLYELFKLMASGTPVHLPPEVKDTEKNTSV